MLNDYRLVHVLIFVLLLAGAQHVFDATASATVGVSVPSGYSLNVYYPYQNHTVNAPWTNVHLSPTNPSQWCGGNANNNQNVTFTKEGTLWSGNITLNFGHNFVRIYCNKTSGASVSESRGIFAFDSNELPYEFFGEDFLGEGESYDDYFDNDHINQTQFSCGDSYTGFKPNFTYGGFVDLVMDHFTFGNSCVSNFTVVEYKKHPPTVFNFSLEFSDFSPAKYFDIKASGFDSGLSTFNITYTDAEVLNLQESTLKAYMGFSGNWTLSNQTNLYTDENKITVSEDISNFTGTEFAIAGEPVGATTTTTASAGVSGVVSGAGRFNPTTSTTFIAPKVIFQSSPDIIKFKIRRGELGSKSFVLMNTGDLDVGVGLSVVGLDKHIFLSDYKFNLSVGDEKRIKVDLVDLDELDPGVYTGKIAVVSGDFSIEVDLVLEIQSEDVIFDIIVDIPSQFEHVLPGGEVVASIDVLNLGVNKRLDVLVVYGLKDYYGGTIVSNEETVAVETRMSLTKSFFVPKNLNPGRYLFFVEVRVDDTIATGSKSFDVISLEDKPELDSRIYIGLGLILVGLGLLIFWVGRYGMIQVGSVHRRRSKKKK